MQMSEEGRYPKIEGWGHLMVGEENPNISTEEFKES